MMKSFLFLNVLALLPWVTVAAPIADKEPTPVWELTRNFTEPTVKRGTVRLVDGIIRLDGTNTFSLPPAALGEQKNYTIEFKVKRPTATTDGNFIQLFSNSDENGKVGLRMTYFPPAYNAIKLYVNGHETVELRGFLTDDAKSSDKVTIVVQDRKLSLFRNGLVLAVTGEVNPSALPLTFGSIEKQPPGAYELSEIKIYDAAIFPTGFDQSAERMRNYSGDGYFMQRVEIKDPTLPRILVVGDSISMGYREFITRHFKGRAYVDYWVGGAWIDPNSVRGENSPVKRAWSGVLSNGPYDVVSWNAMTLHMWNPDVPERSPEETYSGNMTEVVEHLRKVAPQTKFIWIRSTPFTTPVEGGPNLIDVERSRIIIQRNKMTDEIMQKYGIPEIDLYALIERNLDKASKDGVHWQESASQLMAAEIIKEIEKDFPKQHWAK